MNDIPELKEARKVGFTLTWEVWAEFLRGNDPKYEIEYKKGKWKDRDGILR